MKVIPFHPDHLEQIEIRECYSPGECPKTVLTTAFTFIDSKGIVAIIGGFPFIPGVIHFWGLLSNGVTRRPIEFQKEILKMLRWYEVNEKPRRLQIDVRADYPMGQRWAESLGFRFEGVLSRWSPDGTDAYLYGRACPWQS